MINETIEKDINTLWFAAQQWELHWWSNARDQWAMEQHKGTTVAQLMYLPTDFNMESRRILDVGSGPFSLLLRTKPWGGHVALDPLTFIEEAEHVYREHGIDRWFMAAEDLANIDNPPFDEVWIYNCLQHTKSPQIILAKIAQYAPIIRLFEWCNIPPYTGHLHMITTQLIRNAFPESVWIRDVWDEGNLHDDGMFGDYLAAVIRKI